MEKKEREQLKGRLLKMVVNEPRLESMPPMTMAEVMVNSMSKPNLEPLLDFISQELDKAREEQFTQKELKRIEELLGFMLSDYPSSFWKPEDKSIEKKLSKLKQ